MSAVPADVAAPALLEVRDVRKLFQSRRRFRAAARTVFAVDGVSFDVQAGETLGLVGESGCGKSTLARVVTGLYRPTEGTIRLRGADVEGRGSRRRIAGEIQMVFQDPASSLDPRQRIASSVGEPLLGRVPRAEREARALEMLERVGLGAEFGTRYPRELSGGQQQRACIARALISRPSLVVLDEALSSLDVSLQAQMVDLLRDLQDEYGSSYVFITHDLATAFELSARVAIMYLGEIVELIPVSAFGTGTLHPYARALVDATLAPDPRLHRRHKTVQLEGEIPSAADPPTGCRFHTRCPFAQARCSQERPALELRGAEHWAACHFAGELPISSDGAAG